MLNSRSVAAAVGPSLSAPPRLERLIAPRPRLIAPLDTALFASPVVIVAGEAGSGKTTIASAWVGRAGHRPDVAWHSLRRGRTAIAELGAISERHGNPRVIVVDDVPIGPDDELDAAFERLLLRSDSEQRIVVLAAGDPALDLKRLGAGTECLAVGPDELAFDTDEIASLLARFGRAADPDLVAAIKDRTYGWALGVRRVAFKLAHGSSATQALRDVELTIASLLENSILRGLPPLDRQLITETSMVTEVASEHVISIVGDAGLLSAETANRTRGFVRVSADGSFSVHPLLRRHLLKQLRRSPTATRIATTRAVRCAVGRGDLAAAVDLCINAADWSGAAELLIESLQVPRLLAAGAAARQPDDVVDGLGSVSALLRATAALGRSWPNVAAQAIQELPVVESGSQTDPAANPASIATRLSQALVAMVLARWRGDPVAGRRAHRRAADLLPELPAAKRSAAPVLAPLLQAHLAAFEIADGAPDRARATLESGSRAFRPKASPASPDADLGTQIAAADCLGQLAWIEAVDGSLTGALRCAADVLTARPADSTETGVVYAQLSSVWCDISRIELEPAVQRFESLTARYPATADAAMLPELVVAISLTAARLSAATGSGEIGQARNRCEQISYEVRRLCRSAPGVSAAYEQQLQLIRAEAELDAGEPTTALRLLNEGSQVGTDACVLRARAWIQLGDRAAVASALRVRPVVPLSVLTRLQLELVEGWLAQPRDRALLRSRVDRALRIAHREQLRAPIAWAKPWLHNLVTADPGLLQRYGSFLASIRCNRLASARDATPSISTAAPVSALTERELDILQRLGALSTNEEIAADLHLSPNTIKTHLRSLYRKLEVTRRSDAFRRGRALGLC